MRLLLISNSTNANEAYLEYPKYEIKSFLDKSSVKKVLFIPYAAVTFSYDEYLVKVQNRFSEIGIEVTSIHTYDDPVSAVAQADAIVVGGGNTFHLVKNMYDQGVMDVIAQRVKDGIPYVGWSAGSNVVAPTLCTTNDMPIVSVASFKTLSLIPFQINPHYIDTHPDGHAGETREQRIEEYIAANKSVYVAGLREGCMLNIEEDKMSLIGPRPVRIFRYGQKPKEYSSCEDISFLLHI